MRVLITLCLITSYSTGSRRVPVDFTFGSATSAYQVEGAWNLDGKGESIWDRLVHTNGHLIADGGTGDIACDGYRLYRHDVRLMKTIGLQYYRFSIAWSRVLPTGFSNVVNAEAVRYYNDLIDELLAQGIEPMVTLYHFDLPQKLQDLGGWTNAKIAKWFVDYADVVFRLFGDRVKLWITINEPKQICHYGYGRGYFAPLVDSHGIGEYMCARNILIAHASVYRLYRRRFQSTQKGRVGITIECGWVEPDSNATRDVAAAERHMQFDFGLYAHAIHIGDYPEVVRSFVDARSRAENFTESRLPRLTSREIEFVRGTHDFFGLNYYMSYYGKDRKSDPPGAPSFVSDYRVSTRQDPNWLTGNFPLFRSVPWAFRKLLNYIKDNYQDPEVIVTEIGFPDDGRLDDFDRIEFLRGHLGALLDAVVYDRVRVKTLIVWSLMDNFEWINGYTLRFGLYHVDFTHPNKTRTLKRSAKFLKDLIATRVLK